MADGQVVIPAAFEEGWKLLTDEERGHYEARAISERAGLLMSMTAVMGACQEAPVSEEQMAGLRESLSNRHPSDLEEIHETVRELGRKLLLEPFLVTPQSRVGSVATVHALRPEAPVVVEPEPVITEPATPIEAVVSEPEPESEVAPEPTPVPEEEPHMEDEPASEVQKDALVFIFGKGSRLSVEQLTKAEADALFVSLADTFIDNCTRKPTAKESVEHWFEYLNGKSDIELGEEIGSNAIAVYQRRLRIYALLRKLDPPLDLEQMLGSVRGATTLSDTVSQPESQQDEEITAPIEVPEPEAEDGKSAVELLDDTVQEWADSLGLSPRQKDGLRKRFSLDKVEPLTNEAQQALIELGLEFTYVEKEGIVFTAVETKAMGLLLGENNRQGKKPMPAHFIKGVLKGELAGENGDLARVFLNVMQKINNYKHVRSSTDSTDN